jgi:hypothetical protein
MRKDPENVVIGPIAYQIIFEDMQGQVVNSFGDDPCAKGENDIFVDIEGNISHQHSTILVHQKLEPSYKRVVLMHEILHGISRVTRTDLTEAQCDQLAYALIDLFNDNPGLMEWMM